MRTDHSDPLSSVRARLRAGTDRVRRRVASLGAGSRVALAAAGLLTLLAVAGYMTSGEDPASRTWLYGGHQFAPGDVSKILSALSAKGIDANEDGGRIEVPRDRQAEAQTTLDTSGLGLRTIRDILDNPPNRSIFATLDESEQDRKRHQEKAIEALIAGIDGTPPAIVQVDRPRRRSFGGTTEPVQVRVCLQVSNERLVPSKTIEQIKGVLLGWVSGLTLEGLTLFDSHGNYYLQADNPALGERSLVHVRQEELEEKILEELYFLEDVHVSVRIDMTEPSEASPPIRPLAVNEPLDVTTEPTGPEPNTTGGRVRVLVQVPISYYKRYFRAISEKPPASGGSSGIRREDRAFDRDRGRADRAGGSTGSADRQDHGSDRRPGPEAPDVPLGRLGDEPGAVLVATGGGDGRRRSGRGGLGRGLGTEARLQAAGRAGRGADAAGSLR